jgi:hypothetical protein
VSLVTLTDHPKPQKLVAEFVATDADAAEVKRLCELVTAAFVTPSKETASELFALGGAAVVVATRAERNDA